MCFFFFKQKTAYEMLISDWSSDVCSSDLPDGKHLLAHELTHVVQQKGMGKTRGLQRQSTGNTAETKQLALADPLTDQEWLRVRAWQERGAVGFDRSEERRVGTGGVSPSKSRWSANDYKKKVRENEE